jgi:hypothetical protein
MTITHMPCTSPTDCLDRLKPVDTAFHDHTNAAVACLEGTRKELLANTAIWMTDYSSPKVFYLSGGAGTGKTAVAHSVVARAKELGFLTASFFFSHTAENRSRYGNVIPTLAYQLGKSKRLCHAVCAAVESDGDVGIRPLRIQAEKLIQDILAPLPPDTSPCVLIVLDALDECTEKSKYVHGADLISILLASLRNIPFAKMFVTSRPESRIETLFKRRATTLNTHALVLHRDIPKDTAQADIDRYLRDELMKMKEDVVPEVEFPSESDIQKLVQEADGLFVYARIAVEYIREDDSSPDVQLKTLTQAKDSGRIIAENGLLDELYTRILANALQITTNQCIVNDRLRSFLTTLALVQEPLALESLTELAGTEKDECARFLRRISAILNYTNITSQPVHLMHRSFSDFLVHRIRDGNFSGYEMKPAQDHLWLTECCLRRLNPDLIHVIYGTRDPPLLLDKTTGLYKPLPDSLCYACRFWGVHWLAHIHAAGIECCAPQGLDELCNGRQLLLWIDVYGALYGFYAAQQIMSELIACLSVGVSHLVRIARKTKSYRRVILIWRFGAFSHCWLMP